MGLAGGQSVDDLRVTCSCLLPQSYTVRTTACAEAMACCPLLVFSLFLGGSLTLVVFKGLFPSLRFYRTQNWVKARGTVDNHYLSTTKSEAGASVPRCHVEYSYSVDGTDFTGDRASFDTRTGSRNLCNRLAKMKAPKKVTVFYDSEDPAQSVLAAKLTTLPVMGYALLSIGVLFLVWGFLLPCLHSAESRMEQPDSADETFVCCDGPFESRSSLTILLAIAVHCCLCGALLLAVSIEALYRRIKIAIATLVVGSVLILAGVLSAVLLLRKILVKSK